MHSKLFWVFLLLGWTSLAVLALPPNLYSTHADAVKRSHSPSARGGLKLGNPMENVKAAVHSTLKDAWNKITNAEKKDFEFTLEMEAHIVKMKSQQIERFSKDFYVEDMIPHMFSYMQKYTKQNMRKIRDEFGNYRQYTRGIVHYSAMNEAVRLGCSKPSVMVAAGIILGAYQSEMREDKVMEAEIFSLLSQAIERDTKKRPQTVQEMRKCEDVIRKNINIDIAKKYNDGIHKFLQVLKDE